MPAWTDLSSQVSAVICGNGAPGNNTTFLEHPPKTTSTPTHNSNVLE